MAPTPDPTDTLLVMGMPIASNTGVSGRWLMVVRLLWMLIVSLTFWVIVASIPIYFAALSTLCTRGPCADYQLTPSTLRVLQPLGISLSSYAVSFFTFKCLAILPWFAVAVLIFWRKSADWFAMVVALFLVLLGTFENIQVETILSGPHTLWWGLLTGLVFFTFTLFFLVFSLFPTGRFVPQWIGLLFALWCLFLLSVAFFQGTRFDIYTWSEPLGNLVWFGLLGMTGVAQIYRYRRVSNTVQRQQTKWVVYPMAVISIFYMGISILFVLVPMLNQPTTLFPLVRTHLINIFALLIPCSIGIAILRYHLLDIDFIINRTLVYGTLTASIVGIYVLVVVSLGALLRAEGNLLISLLATGIIAVLFQPMRVHLQHGVNRLMYGQRDEPYTVIARLSQRLKGTFAPDEVLSTIAETVAQALKLPYVAILWKQEETLELAASYGRSEGELLTLPLVYQAETIGQLQLAPRAPGEAFTTADVRLLDELARQAGLAAHAVRLATDLQKARERLVLAREEERRRLRRDLHDGVGPTLASLSQRIDTACLLVPRDPDAAIAQLRNLKAQVKSTIADIRRVVYALRPPVLDEMGLVSAISEHAIQLQDVNGLRISIETPADLPPLPAAVEVAAYRIALEALTNVERHAHAQHSLVRLELADEQSLCLSIIDDGRGLPVDYHAGVGITSMHERVAELGGECTITAKPGSGTCVQVRLPLRS